MRIKRLELLGFKSFMSKTVINFDKGLTGVVGPNGCGKSNIVDALLWVMGEQSPKSLRGSSMEDVIFNGSDKRKPSSLAEVTIVLENDGVFPAGYINFSEIGVTRRLYRNGESEYLINKVPVRLKDVKEIFMDSGARTYAVIEQGEIERIILAKPEDRRVIIEEAAGITKYKSRKEESQRKLETTEQNLLRLNDIITELSRQLTDVERQAKKAQNYKKLSEDLKSLELNLGSKEYLRLEEKASVLRAEIETLEKEKLDLTNSVSKIELDIESEKSRKLAVESEVSGLQNKTVDLNTAINTASARLDMIQDEKANITRNAELRSFEVEALKVRIERTENELAGIGNDFASQEDLVNAANKDVAEAEAELNKRLSDYEAVSSSVESKRTKIMECVQNELSAGNNIKNFEERLESNQIQLERRQEEKSKYETELNSTKETLSLLEANFGDNQKKRKELEDELNALRSTYEKLKVVVTEKEAEIDQTRMKQGSVNSRLEVLCEISNRLENVSSGTKFVFESNRWNDKIKGFLADVVTVAPEYERAVEAVIGEKLDAIIIDDGYSAANIIDSLKGEIKGQACFIPSDLRGSDKVFDNSMFGWLKGEKATCLADLISCTSENESLTKRIFSNVYLVDDISKALELWRKAKTRDFILVTRDGDVVDGSGAIRGGSPEAIGSGVLERKREIKDLETERDDINQKLEQLNSEYNTLNLQISESSSRVDNLNLGISSVQQTIALVSKDMEHIREDVKRQEQRLSELTFDIDQLRFENSHLEKEIENAKKTLQSNAEIKAKLDVEVQSEKAKIDSLTAELDTYRNNVLNLKMKASTLSERFKSVEDKKLFLEEGIKTDRDRLNTLLTDGERHGNRLKELDSEYADNERIKRESTVSLDDINRQVEEVRIKHADFLSEIAKMERTVRDLRASLDGKSKTSAEVNANLSSISVEFGVLKQRYADRYEVDLAQCWNDHNNVELDEEKAREDVLNLNKKLSDMGHVNLLAIEEYDKLVERHQFLTIQRDDLVNSMEDLKVAIRKIDETSRTRFKATFEMVNEKFKKFFPILFGGGSAELVMTDPENLLVTGVDIFAQMPGKKTQNINLFSGGEKALTAISLVFSIFAIKPSPFCILDEVDAPLDDANITRFNEAVRALMERSQFIVITHNKKTMAMLDVLYGITMEDPGISRVVSVRLGDFNPTDKISFKKALKSAKEEVERGQEELTLD